MLGFLRIVVTLNSNHFRGTHVPVEEPSTASVAEVIDEPMDGARLNGG